MCDWLCLKNSVVLQLLSPVYLFATLWTTACQGPLSSPVSWSLLIFLSLKSVMLSNHLIFCHPLLLSSVLSSSRDFSTESALCIRWPKYWSFSISPSKEYSGLILFRIDWFELLAGQGTLRSLLQNHSSKASIPWCPGFSVVQLSHPYMTAEKTIALTIQTFLGKVSLLFFLIRCLGLS